MTKRIVLCADDYGQAPHISKGILSLLNLGRLSATSCMVNMPHWQEHASWLTPYQALVDIGLHFNLTEGVAVSKVYRDAYGSQFLPLPSLLKKTLLRQVDQSIIEAECAAQVELFQQTLGQLPCFIDGHQHVHQFPVVRKAIVAVYKRYLAPPSYVRVVKTPINNFKTLIIHATGTKALQKLLKAHHIPHNHSFAGIYGFENAKKYPELFPKFLKDIQENGILMCHPGVPTDSDKDPIAIARQHEYRYLSSNQFLLDCGKYNIAIARFV